MHKSKVQNINDLIVVSDSIARTADTTAYTAGDAVSEVTTNDYYTFGGILRPGQKSGTIKGGIITSSANVGTKPDLELWLFSRAIGEAVDNAAFAPSDAQLAYMVGVVKFPVGDWLQGNAGVGAAGNSICFAAPDLVFSGITVGSNGPELYGQLVIRNAYVPVSGETFKTTLLVASD